MCFLGILRFLLKFTGKDEEINLLGDGTEKPEFGEWSWISPDQIIELVRNFCFLYCDELQHLDSATSLLIFFYFCHRQWISRSQCTKKSCRFSPLISSKKETENSLFMFLARNSIISCS